MLTNVSTVRMMNIISWCIRTPVVNNQKSTKARKIKKFFLCFSSKLRSEVAMLKRRGMLTGGARNGQGGGESSSPNRGASSLVHQNHMVGGLRSNGIIFTPVWTHGPVAAVGHQADRTCGRCRSELGRIMNRGAICPSCRVRVCKSCREYGPRLKNHEWLCTLCHKNM